MNERSNALAERLEQGARALTVLASGLSDAEWQTRIPHDGRTIGVVVHHVATMYPLEIKLAQLLATGQPIIGVTSEVINEVNATHASEYAKVTKQEALDLLGSWSSPSPAAGADELPELR